MPGINGKALDQALDLAESILKLNVGEKLEIKFKGETVVYKRIR